MSFGVIKEPSPTSLTNLNNMKKLTNDQKFELQQKQLDNYLKASFYGYSTMNEGTTNGEIFLSPLY